LKIPRGIWKRNDIVSRNGVARFESDGDAVGPFAGCRKFCAKGGHEVRGACDRAVEQALAMTGGELLSVQPARNGKPICRVTVLVVKPNGRPKKIRLRIPMDY
jgi:hypothetical protein